jgi:DNA-binding NtrC family response regulator
MRQKVNPAHPILFVDDEEHYLLSVELIMASHGINNIETCGDSRTVMDRLSRTPHDLVVLDINMPHLTGFELLPQLLATYPEMNVIVATAVNDVASAVRCMKMGAFDYILKPADETRLVAAVKHGLELTDIRSENAMLKQSFLRETVEHPESFAGIFTRSRAMQSLFKYIEAIAPTDLPILITGETGSGKELFATALHRASRRSGELVTVNVAGVDDNLFSDTLFGHRKGAFTGADAERKGLIEKADNGTLFLDEIGDLSIESQVKLLRLLQDGQYYPLGSDSARLSNARIIVATHRDIYALQRDGRFRADLYYRLKAHHINIPPLRERRSDIPMLIDHFVSLAAAQLGKKRPTLPREIYPLLSTYHFPGNVRELQGLLFDAISIHTSGVLSLESLRTKLAVDRADMKSRSIVPQEPSPLRDRIIDFPGRFPTLKEAEEVLIAEALERSKQNQTIAAELLGISRRALNNRLRRKDTGGQA